VIGARSWCVRLASLPTHGTPYVVLMLSQHHCPMQKVLGEAPLPLPSPATDVGPHPYGTCASDAAGHSPRPSLSPLCFTPFVALLLPSLCFLLEQRANAFAAAAGAKSCPQVAQSTATDDAAKGFTLGAVTRAHATVAHVWQLRRRFTAAHVRGLPFRRTCGSPVCCPPFLPAPFIPARTPGQKTVFFCIS
jgi:hypothetical protein